MKDDSILGYVGSGLGAIFSAIQSNEIFSIISWVLTLIATLVSITYTLYKWYRRAKKDGKIDDEEIEEGLKILNDHIGEKDDDKKE